MTFKIDNQKTRLILTPKCTLVDDLKWLRYVYSIVPTECAGVVGRKKAAVVSERRAAA